MKSQRLGMWMIAAALAVIVLIGGLLFERQAKVRDSRIQAQGAGLVRMLSRMPYEQLVPHTGNPGVLQSVLQVLGGEVGYGIIENLGGEMVAEVGTIDASRIPAPPRTREPASWFGVRDVTSEVDGRRIREFYGPVLDKGAIAGQIRLGFADASLAAVAREQVSFAALIALPIFLLAPSCWFMLRREMRPLQALGQQLRDLTDARQMPVVEMGRGDDLRDFADGFGRFLEAAQSRMHELESERFDTVVSGRLLAYQQEKADAVLQALPEGAMVLDTAGTIVYANAKVDPILAVDGAGALVGRLATEAVGAAEVAALIARCQARQGQAMRAETIEFSPAGAPDRTISAGAYPLPSTHDASNLLGTLVVLRDVTQQRLARQAGSEFVAHVSHELKSPLNVLLMNSELLQSDLADSPELRTEAVNVIHDEVERMAKLIDDLLNVSRIESGSVSLDRQRVRLHELLRDVFDEVSLNAAGKDIRFEYRVPDELAPLLLDKGLLRIALANLLTNAIKYNRPGGTVSFSAEETDEHVMVQVRDSGIGIAPADQARVFDKFFRSSDSAARERSGHGLGLYLSREICALHQGELTLDSEPGVGTEFTMRLRKTAALVQEAVRL